MSSKPKALLNKSKSKHKREQKLETADDYQAAGVDFEDAAGKWRAGDAVKSMRFFQRAVEVYEEGLNKFPRSFDLAYNKARVLLEIATHPILVKQLHQSVLATLQAALDAHRYALELDRDNPDTLFNTSQVLTTIAEEVARDDDIENSEALRYLEEALELQNRCLSLQEMKYEEGLEQQKAMTSRGDVAAEMTVSDDEGDGGVSLDTSQEPSEQWFSIIEPVTLDTLIDTALAQLGTLTTLCGILSASPGAGPEAMLAWVEEYSSKILNDKLPGYSQTGNTRLSEIALVKANFASAILEAGFRSNRLDAATYKRERDAAFKASELVLEQSLDVLLANARSLVSFNSALADSMSERSSERLNEQWNALSAAITNLVTASKLPGIAAEDLAQTHLLRGDCSMLQYQMSLPPIEYPSAISNAPQLLKNAEVFYRNAGKLAMQKEEKEVAGFRSAIAQFMQQADSSALRSFGKPNGQAWIIGQLVDMIEEGLLPSNFQLP